MLSYDGFRGIQNCQFIPATKGITLSIKSSIYADRIFITSNTPMDILTVNNLLPAQLKFFQVMLSEIETLSACSNKDGTTGKCSRTQAFTHWMCISSLMSQSNRNSH